MIGRFSVAVLAVLAVLGHLTNPTSCALDDIGAVANLASNPLVVRETDTESTCRISKWENGSVEVFTYMQADDGWDCSQMPRMYEWLIENCQGEPASMIVVEDRCFMIISFKSKNTFDGMIEGSLCVAGFLTCPRDDFPLTRGTFRPGDCVSCSNSTITKTSLTAYSKF